MAAAEALAQTGSPLPHELVFVDLETTGGNAAHHRITEVGIVRMSGGAVVDEWSSLVNPECRIPPYIESFTGISNEMVAGAPRFAEIAPQVLEKLRGPVFVAHNARFDYTFLRTAFQRLEMAFSARVLCTVKLSRRLFPEHRRHSLDAVMDRHSLACTARHRALGDARVLGEFWSTLLRDVPEPTLAEAVRLVIGTNRLPAYLPATLCDELPEGAGVYRLLGEDGAPLYIGRSHALRTRILGHFGADAREQKKARLTRRIDWVETAGDLGARLLECRWIREQTPLFNQRRRAGAGSCTLRVPGPAVQFTAMEELDPAQLDACFGVFHSHQDARKALMEIARGHALCLKVLGLESGEGSCVAYQLGKCRGACAGKEPLLRHRTRLIMALSALKLKQWPFPGRIALKEGRSEYHVLDAWAYLGTAHGEEEFAELSAAPAAQRFDIDVYRILSRHLAKGAPWEWLDLSTGLRRTQFD